jgi:hypothetical protein
MSIADKNYFGDLENQITDADRIKAGYRIPKTHAGLPSAISAESLRGNLSGIAVPIPMNFHEGGMFNDSDDRRSYETRRPQSSMKQVKSTPVLSNCKSESDRYVYVMVGSEPKEVEIRSRDDIFNELLKNTATRNEPIATRNEPIAAIGDDIISTVDKDITVQSSSDHVANSNGELLERLWKPTDDYDCKRDDNRQLIGQSSNNPFKPAPLVDEPNHLVKTQIGENKVIIARGPDNIYGRNGFYAGIFTADRFDKCQTEQAQYNPFDAIDDGSFNDQTGFINTLQIETVPKLENISKESPSNESLSQIDNFSKLLIVQSQLIEKLNNQVEALTGQVNILTASIEKLQNPEPADKIEPTDLVTKLKNLFYWYQDY